MRRILPLLIVLSLGFAPAPVYRGKDDTRTDLEKMQGSWVRVSYSSCGRWSPDGKTIIEFAGDHMTMSLNGKDEWVAEIDPKTNPKRIDQKGYSERVKSYQFMGVYRLDGDTLMIATRQGSSEEDRPMNFDRNALGVIIEHLERRRK
jgi:uncharacterized protein (TIGR03067 family)